MSTKTKIAIFSYPFLYMLQSGNVEIVTCVFTASGLLLLLKRHDHAAAICWAAAGAFKIYPIILLAIFLSKTKWRSFLLGLAAFASICLLSMWFVGPTISAAFSGTINGVGGFVSTYAERVKTNELPIDHSLLAPIKIFGYEMAHRTGTLSYLTKPYIVVAGTLATLVYFLRVRNMPLANQAIFLFASMIVLPPVSFEYTTVHMYAPWAMLVIVALRAAYEGKKLQGLRTMFICFAVMFTSQRYIYYHWIYPNGTFKVIALVILIVVALRYPIPDELLQLKETTTVPLKASSESADFRYLS